MNSTTGSHSPALSSNPNMVWAEILVGELALCGLSAVCIAPGSRSTPLTLAFDAHPDVKVYRHLDERSAAFFALGLALAQNMPVALLCTSGTAAANFHPAIIEAYHSQVPLLVLTADRPPELRHSGANQTIDQVKMYGDHVLWSVDMALPQADPPAVALNNLRTTAARAYARSNGIVSGPVHLNLPYRKPLQPSPGEAAAWQSRRVGRQSTRNSQQAPYTKISHGVMTLAADQLDFLAEVIETYQRGLIICGPRCPSGDFPEAAAALSQTTGFPLLADPISGLRFGPQAAAASVIGGYDTFLDGGIPAWEQPDLVIRFGNVPTSKALNTYLEEVDAKCRIHISRSGIWADDSHRVTDFLQADPAQTCRQLVDRLTARSDLQWMDRWQAVERASWKAMDEALTGAYFDGAVMADVVDGLMPGTRLFTGNSLSVRHLGQFGRPRIGGIEAFANRGASGIDGNVSTALGIGAGGSQSMVAVMGDITFYHDMNGLLAAKNPDLNATIILLNNDGGGIFRRLPVANFEPPFSELFITPHGLDFEPVARMYGLDYVRVSNRAEFKENYAASLRQGGVQVIEVRTDGRRDHARRQEVIEYVNGRISESFAAVE